MKAKRSFYNIIVSFITQIITMALGIFLPRLILVSFGSATNGLLSSINQILMYFELLSAGIGTAALQALYKPIVNNDKETISEILSTSKQYCFKIGFIYLFGVILLALGFAFFGKIDIPIWQVFLIIILQGISGFLNFTFRAYFIQYLTAEGKNYVITSIQFICQLLIQICKIIIIITIKNVVVMQFSYLAITLIQLLFYKIYQKKFYSWIDYSKKPNKSLLKNKNSYLIHHVSGLICTSTDTVVISIFCGFSMASVYSVYALIFHAVDTIIGTIQSSTEFLFGYQYNENKAKYKIFNDIYYLFYITLVVAMFSICYVFILPFVALYTKGITDIRYIDKFIPLLFALIQIFYASKRIGNVSINLSGRANKVAARAVIEAIINIVISLILVNFIGIYGVLIGTIIALFYRMNDVMIYSNKYVLERKPYKNYFVLITNLLLFAIIVIITNYVDLNINNYAQFIIKLLIGGPIILIIFFAIELLINYKETLIFVKLIKQFLSKRKF